jgi:arabinose-5-phosphate isomerase
MNSTARNIIPKSEFEILSHARKVIQCEASALLNIADQLDDQFCEAIALIQRTEGSVILTGMGKAGLIGQKIVATLSSTGTRSHFLHPAEAVHGDLGCLHQNDLLITLSNSGETEEIVRLIPIVKQMNIPIIAITGRKQSQLGLQADATIEMGQITEAGQHGLAPTTSTTAMLAIGDALALVLSQLKQFTPQQFALFHPAGSLGKQLSIVGDIMRSEEELRIAHEDETIRKVLQQLSQPGRRTGAIILVNDSKELQGLFTDSDLARLLEKRQESQLDRPIHEVMTSKPLTTHKKMEIMEVVELLSRNRISELPVIDENRIPVGLVDITDVIGLMPVESVA